MRKTSKLLAAAYLAVTIATPAFAAPVIQYQILDGSTVIGGGDSTSGNIALNGADSKFALVGGSASSAPLTAVPDFSSNVFTVRSAASNSPATLTVRISTTGLTNYMGGSLLNTFTLNSLNGGSFTSGTISTYFDNSNVAYGTATLLATDTFTGLGALSNSLLVSASPSNMVSETAIYSLNYGSGGASTVSASATVSAVSAVPELGTWAMMIVGMGAVGFALRSARRRSDDKFDAKIKRTTDGALA